MVGPFAYGGFEGRHVDRWLSSHAGWSVDVLRGGTSNSFQSLECHATLRLGGFCLCLRLILLKLQVTH